MVTRPKHVSLAGACDGLPLPPSRLPHKQYHEMQVTF